MYVYAKLYMGTHVCARVRASASARCVSATSAAAENEFEWGGSFMLSGDGSFTWIAQKTGSGDAMDYADPTMKIAVLPSASGDMATLESLESEGNHALEEACTDVLPGGTIPVAMDACARLVFDQDASETHFYIDGSGVEYVAIFAEHFPTEFEQDKHYLSDAEGADIEPIETLGGDGHDHDHDHAHGEPCVCEAVEHGWSIDCGNIAVVVDALNYLLEPTNGCALEDAADDEACHQNYHVMQAHHDFCPHHDLDEAGDVETIIHDFEQLYDDCSIGRMYDPELAMCPEVDCSDSDAMFAVVDTIRSDACATSCTGDCEAAFQTILHVHDVCEEEQIPTLLETSLHDFEELCEEHLCNSVTEEQGMALLDDSQCGEDSE